MRIFIYILIGIAALLFGYNIFKIDSANLFEGDSMVALIGVVASLCAIILLTILLIVRKIARKAK